MTTIGFSLPPLPYLPALFLVLPEGYPELRAGSPVQLDFTAELLYQVTHQAQTQCLGTG